MSRLYFKNLPSHTPRDDIFKYLERFGKLTELKILKSAFGTCGFAQYDSAQDARFVLKTFRDQLFLGHRIIVELARPLRKDMPYAEPSGRKTMLMEPKSYSNRAPCRYPVLVANIPRFICWQELKDFGRLAGGAVAFCDLDPARNGRGFIEYFSREDAEEAVEMLNGQKLGGGVVHVSAYSSAARRRSRSRSPIRRPRRQIPDVLAETESEELPHTFSFPTSAARYSVTRAWSPEIPSQRFISVYPEDPTAAVGSPREAATRGKPMLQTSTDSTGLVKTERPVQAAHDCYDFDAYLRLSYNRHLNGFCVGTGFMHDSNKLEDNAVYIPGFIHSGPRSDSFPSF